jgi:predicted alpha/beta superfamily hydrolase
VRKTIRGLGPLVLVGVLGACSSSSNAPDAPHADAGSAGADGGASSDSGGADAGGSIESGSDASIAQDAGGGADASADSSTLSAGTALVRVHYPATTHAVTIRGGAAGLNWTSGMAMAASGDTYTVTLTGITTPVEWKPLLDDTTWALGPNYHVASGQTVDVYPHFTTTRGRVETLIADFHSTVLNDDRVIYAYLPASYAENTDATYPVVYMHDGQNLWAALPDIAFGATWNVDTTFDTASNTGACSAAGVVGWSAQPLGGTATTCTGDSDCTSGECRTFPEAIIIGVANEADRIYEYTPTTDPSTPGGGGADLYIQMLVEELKPAIDGMLRTRPDVASTAMAGSSLGGLVTAYAGLKHPEVYGLIAAISPSTWWDDDVLVTDIQSTLAAPQRPLIVYVDSGQGTVDDEADTDELAAAYVALGYVQGTNFSHVIQPGAQHSETYWAERFPGAMQLLLGVR